MRGELIKANSIVADYEQASQHVLPAAEGAESVRVARINANVLRMGARMVGSDVRRRFMRPSSLLIMQSKPSHVCPQTDAELEAAASLAFAFACEMTRSFGRTSA